MRFCQALCLLVVAGCGPLVGGSSGGESDSQSTTDASSTTDTPGTSATGTPSTTTPGTSVGPTTTSTSTSTSTSTDTSTTGSSSGDTTAWDPCGDFIGCPDFQHDIECDVWEQDCPAGEKCMPWSDDGNETWNATRCSEIADDPASLGEPCVVFASPYSGSDTCDGTSMCFDVDSDTLEGTCHAFCMGDASDPTCPDDCDACRVSAGGLLNLCLPTCDPLMQDCASGSPCYLILDYFACLPDASGVDGAMGDTCESVDDCDGGLACVPAAAVPDCDGMFCCSPFCSVGDATPCEGLAGTDCLALVEEEPECAPGNVGACMLP